MGSPNHERVAPFISTHLASSFRGMAERFSFAKAEIHLTTSPSGTVHDFVKEHEGHSVMTKVGGTHFAPLDPHRGLLLRQSIPIRFYAPLPCLHSDAASPLCARVVSIVAPRRWLVIQPGPHKDLGMSMYNRTSKTVSLSLAPCLSRC
jgi:hypothetical protein